METKETTVSEIKSSLDELKGIIIAHMQKKALAKIDDIEVAGEDVFFRATKTKELTAQELMHINEIILNGNGNGKEGKRTYKPRENTGLTAWLRETLKDGDKVHIEKLVELAIGSGFPKATVSLLDKYLKQGTMKKDIVEVNKGVFQIREYFEKTHNRNGVAAHAA